MRGAVSKTTPNPAKKANGKKRVRFAKPLIKADDEKMGFSRPALYPPKADAKSSAAKKAEELAAPNPKVVTLAAKGKERGAAGDARKKEDMQAKKDRKVLSVVKGHSSRYRVAAAEVEEKEGAELELKDSTQKKKVLKARAAAKRVVGPARSQIQMLHPLRVKRKK